MRVVGSAPVCAGRAGHVADTTAPMQPLCQRDGSHGWRANANTRSREVFHDERLFELETRAGRKGTVEARIRGPSGAAAELPPPDLFRLAASNKATLALCALRDTGAAMNVLVTPDQVAELAGGRAPTTAE